MRCVAVPFEQLDARTAYAVWKLRQDVFVVEQECPYPDLDGRDVEPGTRHVVLQDGDELLGYARVLDDGDVWRIGRVVLAPPARGRGLADALMTTALQVCGGRDVVLDAQSPLADWYAGFGFEVTGPEFLDDGIPHLPMRRQIERSDVNVVVLLEERLQLLVARLPAALGHLDQPLEVGLARCAGREQDSSDAGSPDSLRKPWMPPSGT